MSTDLYNPNHLIDSMIAKLQLKNDAALANALEVSAPVISKIRNFKLRIGAAFLIRAHEETGMPIRVLRDLMGDRRGLYRMGAMNKRGVEA